MSKAQFDAVIHPRHRLQICALLARLEDAEFRMLGDELEISDSVLSKHIKKLEEAGYVNICKRVVDGRQRTWLGLSKKGRTAFTHHVEELKRLAAMTSVSP